VPLPAASLLADLAAAARTSTTRKRSCAAEAVRALLVDIEQALGQSDLVPVLDGLLAG
jgi:hypothetical protein